MTTDRHEVLRQAATFGARPAREVALELAIKAGKPGERSRSTVARAARFERWLAGEGA